jgi:hypothetical protein
VAFDVDFAEVDRVDGYLDGGELLRGELGGHLPLMVEVYGGLNVNLLRSLHDVSGEFVSGGVRDGERLVVGNMLGDVESFFGGRDRNVLPLYSGVIDACFELVVDGAVGRNALLVQFLVVLAAHPQVLQLALVKTPLLVQHILPLLVQPILSTLD